MVVLDDILVGDLAVVLVDSIMQTIGLRVQK